MCKHGQSIPQRSSLIISSWQRVHLLMLVDLCAIFFLKVHLLQLPSPACTCPKHSVVSSTTPLPWESINFFLPLTTLKTLLSKAF